MSGNTDRFGDALHKALDDARDTNIELVLVRVNFTDHNGKVTYTNIYEEWHVDELEPGPSPDPDWQRTARTRLIVETFARQCPVALPTPNDDPAREATAALKAIPTIRVTQLVGCPVCKVPGGEPCRGELHPARRVDAIYELDRRYSSEHTTDPVEILAAGMSEIQEIVDAVSCPRCRVPVGTLCLNDDVRRGDRTLWVHGERLIASQHTARADGTT